jgi:hypothetical protein
MDRHYTLQEIAAKGEFDYTRMSEKTLLTCRWTLRSESGVPIAVR